MNLNKKSTSPTIFVIFGGTGDLAKKKLLPALYDLEKGGYLSDKFRILGVARKELNDNKYSQIVNKAIQADRHSHRQKNIKKFLDCINYTPGSFTDKEMYKVLKKRIAELETDLGVCANKIFYLAVPPEYFGIISDNLARSGLSKPCSSKTGWARILIEKPFGSDLRSAKALDNKLDRLFKDEQVYRIDHFLAKEAMQNVLTFRFSNTIFKPVWNRKYIERIEVKFHETNDLSKRGSFYDRVGALRDVGQNHLLQMLALVTMDNPGKIESELLQQKRAEIFKVIKPLTAGDIINNVVRGQYQGYKNEKGVQKNSTTETYFKIKTYINNSRWQGVPIIVESGKGLKEKKNEIKIYFKKASPCFCPESHDAHEHKNIISFSFGTRDRINIRFWARKGGVEDEIEKRDMSFNYKNVSKDIDAYEKLLYDAINGERMHFASTAEVMASWKFIDSVQKNWEKTKLHIYRKGSLGPETKL